MVPFGVIFTLKVNGILETGAKNLKIRTELLPTSHGEWEKNRSSRGAGLGKPLMLWVETHKSYIIRARVSGI